MIAVGLCAVCLPTTAKGEITQTAQAVAARGQDAPWITAPAKKAALCIVDTGSDPLPDTSAVVARLSLDGTEGVDADKVAHHGTQMTMIAAAPPNDWGTVGAAGDSINVATVRARRAGLSYTVASDVISGIKMCLENAPIYNIRVISVSIVMGSSLDTDLNFSLNDRLLRARQTGIAVVAAAGNQDGPVQYPAAHPTVLGVGAADSTGTRCPGTASGPEIALTVVGCPAETALLDGTPAWLTGTSPATAYVAGILTQLRGLRPELDVPQAIALLTDRRGALKQLDVTATYEAAGLGGMLQQARAGRQPTSPAAGPATPAPTNEPARTTIAPTIKTKGRATKRQRWAMPRITSVRQRGSRVTVRLATRPAGSTIRLTLLIRTKGHKFANVRRIVTARSRTITARVNGVVTGGTVRIEGGMKHASTSANLPL